MLTYNKDVHSATGLTPNEVRKEKNKLKAKLNVSVKASKENMYPTLEVGDKVKIMRKKAITKKERTSHFLQGEYTVENIATKLGKQYQTTYNKDVHSTTRLTPRKEKNEFKAKLNVSVKAGKENMYPTLEVGDRVKIMRKKAITEKERTSHFLQGEYTVENIATKLGKQYQTLE